MALFPARDPIAQPHLTDWAQGSGSRIGIALVALAAKGDEGLVGVAEAGLAAVDPHLAPHLLHRNQATRSWRTAQLGHMGDEISTIKRTNNQRFAHYPA